MAPRKEKGQTRQSTDRSGDPEYKENDPTIHKHIILIGVYIHVYKRTVRVEY